MSKNKNTKRKLLVLEDLAKLDDAGLREHIVQSYEAKPEDLKGVKFLIAYESVGSWGYDSSAFFLFEKGGKLFEVHASHCSCYGFEGQWKPEKTSLSYLKSDKFSVYLGEYDGCPDANNSAIREYVLAL